MFVFLKENTESYDLVIKFPTHHTGRLDQICEDVVGHLEKDGCSTACDVIPFPVRRHHTRAQNHAIRNTDPFLVYNRMYVQGNDLCKLILDISGLCEKIIHWIDDGKNATQVWHQFAISAVGKSNNHTHCCYYLGSLSSLSDHFRSAPSLAFAPPTIARAASAPTFLAGVVSASPTTAPPLPPFRGWQSRRSRQSRQIVPPMIVARTATVWRSRTTFAWTESARRLPLDAAWLACDTRCFLAGSVG